MYVKYMYNMLLLYGTQWTEWEIVNINQFPKGNGKKQKKNYTSSTASTKEMIRARVLPESCKGGLYKIYPPPPPLLCFP